MKDADAILIALPTPLSRQREPDLSIVEAAARGIARGAPRGAGRRARVDDVARDDARGAAADPRGGLRPEAGEGFYLAMSPERVDPGREDWTTKTTPKVLGGITPECTKRAAEVYRRAIDTVVEVSTPEAAELTKLLENIFRSVNIALVNELAQLCDRMSIDVWEVVERGGDEAVRLHAVQPGPRPRRALHPDRSVLPHLEGARVRLLHRVHRARRQGERGDAVLLPLARLAGAEPREADAR